MKKSFYLLSFLFICASIQAQQIPDGYTYAGSINTSGFRLEKVLVLSPDGKHLVTRHSSPENRKRSIIDVYDVADWQKVQSFEIRRAVFAVNGFFEEGNSDVFYLTGLGFKRHKFNIASQDHQIVRLRKLSTSENEKFRTFCDDPVVVTDKGNTMVTHTMEGKYIMTVAHGETKIYVSNDLIETAVSQ